MSLITEEIKRLRNEAASMILQNGTTARLLREAADTIETMAAKIRQDNRTEEAKDRQENTIEKILTLIDAEAWGYCDYLLKQGIGGNADRHASAVTSNIRDRLMEELPGILSDEYEKAFMDGFESHPTHNTYQKAFEDIRAEINEYGSIWVEYQIKGNTDKDIEKIIENVCKQEKQQILEIIDKHNPDKVGKEKV